MDTALDHTQNLVYNGKTMAFRMQMKTAIQHFRLGDKAAKQTNTTDIHSLWSPQVARAG